MVRSFLLSAALVVQFSAGAVWILIILDMITVADRSHKKIPRDILWEVHSGIPCETCGLRAENFKDDLWVARQQAKNVESVRRRLVGTGSGGPH